MAKQKGSIETLVLSLKPFEMHLAGLVGLHRQVESITNNRKTKFEEQYPNQLFASHVVGAMAEFIVAKALGIEWVGHVNHFGEPDITVKRRSGLIGIEVRYSPQRRDIKVREEDADNTVVIGVTGMPPDFEILGCVTARRAREECRPSSPAKGSPAYFVPVEFQSSIAEFKDWLRC